MRHLEFTGLLIKYIYNTEKTILILTQNMSKKVDSVLDGISNPKHILNLVSQAQRKIDNNNKQSQGRQ